MPTAPSMVVTAPLPALSPDVVGTGVTLPSGQDGVPINSSGLGDEVGRLSALVESGLLPPGTELHVPRRQGGGTRRDQPAWVDRGGRGRAPLPVGQKVCPRSRPALPERMAGVASRAAWRSGGAGCAAGAPPCWDRLGYLGDRLSGALSLLGDRSGDSRLAGLPPRGGPVTTARRPRPRFRGTPSPLHRQGKLRLLVVCRGTPESSPQPGQGPARCRRSPGRGPPHATPDSPGCGSATATGSCGLRRAREDPPPVRRQESANWR